MGAEQFENNYTTQLNGGISNTDTTIVVDAGPTNMTGNFRIKIDNEIILVGTVSGTSFTGCTRGVEGTTAATHSDNAVVKHILTAEALKGSDGEYASKYNPDHESPATAPGIAAEFNGSLDTSWSWFSAPNNSPDYSTYPGYMYLEHTAGTGGGLSRAYAPGANATLAAKLAVTNVSGSGTTRAYILGFSDQESTTPTNFNGLYLIWYSNIVRFTTITRTGGAWSVGAENNIITTNAVDALYLRHTYASGTGSTFASLDGKTWQPGPTASRSLTISHALLIVDATGAFDASWDWIRGWNSVIKKVGK